MAKKILIIEDNRDLADLLGMHLWELAFDVDIAVMVYQALSRRRTTDKT